MQSLVEILSRVVRLETAATGSLQFGQISHVDPKKQRARMRIGGTDEKPHLSAWFPYNQAGGALKFHNPPSVGQQFALLANGGDTRQAVGIPMTFSDSNTSPSEKGDEHVMTFGSAKVELRSGEIVVTVPKVKLVCGGSTFELTGSGLKMVAPDFQFDH